MRAVLDWLGANPGWLLILDNIDTPQPLAEAERLIGQLAGGHVVITSRLANFPADVDPLEVDVLDVGDAADFLLERTARQRRPAADDKAMARELAVDLGGLALALEHAGAYIVRHRASFRRYRELWQGSRDKVISWSDPAVTHYPRAIAATWQTSVAQLADPARRLLERLAWLAPEPVPEFLLDVPIPEDEGEDLHEALADLAAYSLATRDPEEPRFLVHGLVQDVTRRSLDAAASRQRVTEALGWVNAAFDGDPQDVRTWPRLDPLAPHARERDPARRMQAEDRGTDRAADERARRAALREIAARAGGTALSPGAGDRRGELRAGPSRASRSASTTSPNCCRHQPLAEAEPLCAEHWRSTRRVRAGPPCDAQQLADCCETNRLAEAEPLIRRALAIDEASFGPDHPKSRPTSTTSPNCCETPTGWPRRNR